MPNGFPTAWVMNCLKVFSAHTNIHHSDAVTHKHTFSLSEPAPPPSSPPPHSTEQRPDCQLSSPLLTHTRRHQHILFLQLPCFDIRCCRQQTSQCVYSPITSLLMSITGSAFNKSSFYIKCITVNWIIVATKPCFTVLIRYLFFPFFSSCLAAASVQALFTIIISVAAGVFFFFYFPSLHNLVVH